LFQTARPAHIKPMSLSGNGMLDFAPRPYQACLFIGHFGNLLVGWVEVRLHLNTCAIWVRPFLNGETCQHVKDLQPLAAWMLNECLAMLRTVETDDNPAFFLRTSEDLAGLYFICEWSTLDSFENHTQIANLSINSRTKSMPWINPRERSDKSIWPCR
jgi:hypothetical protein